MRKISTKGLSTKSYFVFTLAPKRHLPGGHSAIKFCPLSQLFKNDFPNNMCKRKENHKTGSISWISEIIYAHYESQLSKVPNNTTLFKILTEIDIIAYIPPEE